MKSEVVSEHKVSGGFLSVFSLSLKTPKINDVGHIVQTREVVRQSNSVFVLPYDPKSGDFLAVLQHRAGAIDEESTLVIEPVAGRIDKDLTPSSIAVAELEEEAGLKCEVCDLVYLGDMLLSPGASTEKGSFYLMPCDLSDIQSETKHGLEAEGEDILLLKLNLNSDEYGYLPSLPLGFLTSQAKIRV